MNADSIVALLAPVPAGLLEQGQDVCLKRGKVAFGSRAWDVFRKLDIERDGRPVDAYLYASREDIPSRSVAWHGLYVGHVEGINGQHPEGRRFRPGLALEDGSGWWAVFWEIEDLRQIDPMPMSEFRGIGASRNYARAFVPEGPQIIEHP